MATEVKKGWMPETIGLQPAILYWEVQEVVPVIILFAFGMFIGHMWLCIVGIVLYFFLISKYKEKLPKGFAVNLLYFLSLLPLKHYPSYFSKEFQE